MENKQMRSFLKMKGIPFWKIAETIGVSEPTMTRWMRKPLSAEHHKKIMDAVSKIEGGDQDDEDNQTGK
jgi:transposase-like protein